MCTDLAEERSLTFRVSDAAHFYTICRGISPKPSPPYPNTSILQCRRFTERCHADISQPQRHDLNDSSRHISHGRVAHPIAADTYLSILFVL
ncbi:hypothetical protein KOW79_006762 [Hemibagrus wyckioides]|uniref:Uncharacterized protein n=1 Tax=Hemibagrus wyckioides TaxID=337641 RepID=A0A9D3P0B6_9TELE|nr:hypothetical protein KOW79_006762 [Hemibagrus wyckioides]